MDSENIMIYRRLRTKPKTYLLSQIEWISPSEDLLNNQVMFKGERVEYFISFQVYSEIVTHYNSMYGKPPPFKM